MVAFALLALGAFAASRHFLLPGKTPPSPEKRPAVRLATTASKPFSSAMLASAWQSANAETREEITRRIRTAFSHDATIAGSLSAALLSSDREDAAGAHFALVAMLARAGDIDAALAFAQHAPEGNRAGILAAVFRILAQQGGAAARDLATLLLPSAQTAPEFAEVVDGWVSSHPAQVADYALALPPGEARTLALAKSFDALVLRDPGAAFAKIARLENPSERDDALYAWLTKTDSVQRSPASALAAAGSLANAGLRLQAREHLLREWSATDPDAARRFLESIRATISPVSHDRLLAALAPRNDDEFPRVPAP